MKKYLMLATLVTVALLLFCSCAPSGETATATGTDSNVIGEIHDEDPTGRGITGAWKLPEAEWVSADKPELWFFDAESDKFFCYQVDGAGNVVEQVEGTYRAEGDSLVVYMSGFELVHKYGFDGNGDLVLTAHGKDKLLHRYGFEIKR